MIVRKIVEVKHFQFVLVRCLYIWKERTESFMLIWNNFASKACLDYFKQNKISFKRCFITLNVSWNSPVYTKEKRIIEIIHWSRWKWQRRQRRGHQKERLWLQLSEITKVFCWSIIFRKVIIIIINTFSTRKKRIIFHQDSARVDPSVLTLAKFKELKSELLVYTEYSTDSGHQTWKKPDWKASYIKWQSYCIRRWIFSRLSTIKL